jgi:hypothetical protein
MAKLLFLVVFFGVMLLLGQLTQQVLKHGLWWAYALLWVGVYALGYAVSTPEEKAGYARTIARWRAWLLRRPAPPDDRHGSSGSQLE